MQPSETTLNVSRVFREESARLVAGLTRLVRDVGVAEELAQDALVLALEHWPDRGIPENPGAWLMAVGKRRAVNHLRRGKMLGQKHEQIFLEGEEFGGSEPSAEELVAATEGIGDDVLRLMFVSCHPVLPPEGRVALTLRLLGGLSTEEIARAFLAPEPTIAQRIVRAKRTLAEKRVPFEVPEGDALGERLGSVLDVLYLIFNEGNAASAGDEWVRPPLADEAMRLGRILVRVAPEEAEVHGLLALMELTASRFAARVGDDGEPVLLLDQDRGRWDRGLISSGLESLRRAEEFAGEERGRFLIQAGITACHAQAGAAAETDWERIVGLYDELIGIQPTAVVALNRAVAISMARGAEAGLECLEELREEPALRGFALLYAARGEMLEKVGRREEARDEFRRAAELTENSKRRERLMGRAGRRGKAS